MSAVRVQRVSSVAFDVTDVDRAAHFFEDNIGLTVVDRSPGVCRLRGAGRQHHLVSLYAAPRRAVRRVVFSAATRDDVDVIRGRVLERGLAAETPRDIESEAGYGFGFRDPEGRNYAVVCSGHDHAEELDLPDSPVKIAHVNLNTADQDATADTLVGALGFHLIDETSLNRFLCCGSDHHSVVVGQGGIATLNHVAFEMRGLDATMRGAGNLRHAGFPIEWGVGRHGPGDNVFAYFIGPEELPLELTAEVLQIDETYRPHGPDYWQWPPGRQDQWGISDPPTARWRRIQRLVHFTPDGWRTRG